MLVEHEGRAATADPGAWVAATADPGARVAASAGPHAHLNGVEVGDDAFIATGAALFPGARVGAGAEVRSNGVVHVNSAPADGAVVRIGRIAVGDPAEILPPDRHDDIWAIQRELDLPRTVLGTERGASAAEATRRYAELFGRHRDDTVVG